MTPAQKRAFKTADLSNGDFFNDFKDSLSGDLNIERILKTCRFWKVSNGTCKEHLLAILKCIYQGIPPPKLTTLKWGFLTGKKFPIYIWLVASSLRSVLVVGSCLPWIQAHRMGTSLGWRKEHLVSTKNASWKYIQFSLLLALASTKSDWYGERFVCRSSLCGTNTSTVLLVRGSNIPPSGRTRIPVQRGVPCWALSSIALVMQSYWCRFWGTANRPPGSSPHFRLQKKLSRRSLYIISVIFGWTHFVSTARKKSWVRQKAQTRRCCHCTITWPER